MYNVKYLLLEPVEVPHFPLLTLLFLAVDAITTTTKIIK